MNKPRHPELEGYNPRTLYTIELKKQGQTRRDRMAWGLFGVSLGVAIAVGAYTGFKFYGHSLGALVSQQPTVDRYTQGIHQAMKAAELTQSAQSREDWITVGMLWEGAIHHMRAVASTDARHPLAQEKAAEYERNRQYAQSNITTRPAQAPDQPVHWTIGSDRDRVINVQGTPSEVIRYHHSCQETLRYGNSTVELKNGYVSRYDNADNNLKVLATDQVVLSVQPQPDTWSLGSSEQTVLRIQGTPTRTGEYTDEAMTTLYYDDSSVTLYEGQVVSYFNVDRNLNVSLQPRVAAPSQAESAWALGASRTEVLTAQQTTPTHISRNDTLCEEVFHFDEGEVIFSQGTVIGYKNAGQTLRVR